ncbi:MAG: hypothetical protein JKY00_06360 [Roseicyclus sp.]|nr:hypothetical protein [Roseicyclus sp.]
MTHFFRLAAPVTPVTALITSLSIAQAFPQDGPFYQRFSCPVDGFEPGSEGSASLAFPTLCLTGQCCDLSNPINVRDMDETFLYDGECTAEGVGFEARLLKRFAFDLNPPDRRVRVLHKSLPRRSG